MKSIFKLALSIILCEAIGFVGSIFTAPAIPGWYAALLKPAFTPPNWIFAPVWTLLFALMGIAFYLVWARGLETPGVRVALGVFSVQLMLNLAWSVAFFGLRAPLLAMVDIVALWLAILITILKLFPLSRMAGILLVPYLLWVSFALALNYAIVSLNSF